MIDAQIIRENPEVVKKAIKDRNADPKLVDNFLVFDNEWRALMQSVEKLRSIQKQLSKDRDLEGAKKNKAKIKELDAKLKNFEAKREEVWLAIPNFLSEDTPLGKDESDNVVLRKVGEPRKFDFEPKDHVALGADLEVIDIETAAKVSGNRFVYLKGDLVLLQNALHQLVISILTDRKALAAIIKKAKLEVPDRPFTPVVPPLMIKPDVYAKMARLEPIEERYFIESDNVYLVGSAEHSLGPIHMGETLQEKNLPLRYFAFTAAFRREAGSYGQDVRGIIRQHQFDKIEMEIFSLPENSVAEQDFIVAIQERLVSLLKIPYQIIAISTGDIGDPDFRQIDIECWIPSQKKYRETHTSDLMTDYQARRLKTKVKRETGRVEFVHMNDATAFAMGRIMVAIMENYQQEDGSVEIPKVLQPYVGKNKIDVKN